MNGFLYFIEGRDRPVASLEQLAEVGLAYVGKPKYHASCDAGPNGGSGWFLTAGECQGYNAEEQRWKRCADGVWVGVTRGQEPTPRELEREHTLSGPRLSLGGHDWTIPTVLAYDGDANKIPALPRVLDTDDEGKVIPGDVCDAHRWLIEVVDPFLESWTSQRSTAIEAGADSWAFTFDRDTVAKQAVRVLSANYRIERAQEAVLLKLFTTDHGPYEVLYEACDCAFYEYVSGKKKLAATDTASLPTAAG